MKWHRITMPDGQTHTRIVDGDAELIIDEISDVVRCYWRDEPLELDMSPARSCATLLVKGADQSFVEQAAGAVDYELDVDRLIATLDLKTELQREARR